jgi:hypothetical protein
VDTAGRTGAGTKSRSNSDTTTGAQGDGTTSVKSADAF